MISIRLCGLLIFLISLSPVASISQFMNANPHPSNYTFAYEGISLDDYLKGYMELNKDLFKGNEAAVAQAMKAQKNTPTTISVEGEEYIVIMSVIQNYMKDVTYKTDAHIDKEGFHHSDKYERRRDGVYDKYFAVFNPKKVLLYSGYTYEFNRTGDQLLVKIGNELKQFNSMFGGF